MANPLFNATCFGELAVCYFLYSKLVFKLGVAGLKPFVGLSG